MSKLFATLGIVFLHVFSICRNEDTKFVNTQDSTSSGNYKQLLNDRQRQMPQISTKSENSIIYIEKKPKIMTQLKNMKVLRDQKAIFICSSIGNPVPSMMWLVNDNSNLPKRYTVENISPLKSVLRLNPVSVDDDHRRITCRASSVMGTSYSYASLTVYKKKEDIPEGFPFLISKSSVIVNEKNTRVTLECKVDGNPKPNIVWLKDSIPIDLENPRIRFLNNGGLEINKTLEDDEGGYECMADNKHGTIVSPMIQLMIRENVEETYQLIMKNVSYFPPQFVSVPHDQVVLPGSLLTLKCRALGNPIPSVYWKCGQIIFQSHTNSTLQKAEAILVLSDLSESVNCTCIAKNSKESISQFISVTIQAASVAPPNIKVNHITASTCMVSFYQKVVKGDQQRYLLFIIKTSDLNNGKNTKSSIVVNLKKTESEINVNTKIDNLLPFTNYTVWLESFPLQSDSIKSNAESFMTSELPPSSSPRNVELSAISNGALVVMWDSPDVPNGIITSYSIYYTQYWQIPLSRWDKYDVKSTTNYDSKQQIILSHLLNNVTYYISISAQNAAGHGPVSEPQAILVRAGVVQGPKNFRAIAKSSTEIHLFWEPLISKTHINVLYYHLEYAPKPMVHERVQRKWKYSPTQSTISISNLKPNTTYEFHLSADTASASGMTSTVECTTSVKAFEEPILINTRVINSTSIEVSWKTTPEMRKHVEIYRIQCRRYTSNAKDVKDEYVKNSSISTKANDGVARFVFTQLNTNTQYQIYLNTITRHRSGSTFKSEPVKTWPKKLPKPEYLHLRLSCSINDPCVRMEWRPDIKDQRTIRGYQVRYYPLIENGDVKFKIHERNVSQTFYETSSLDHYQGFRYEFNVAAFSEYEIGEESTDQIFILEGTPSVYPSGFKIKSTSQIIPKSVSFTWDKLHQNTLNGRFDHYEVWCYVISQKNETTILQSTNIESITINNLVENANYGCHVRVWIKKSAGLWSDPIHFKTKDAHLQPPDAIRFIRLSHSSALISWKWKPDFLLYYSYFVIYYVNEKTVPNTKIWFVESTKSVFTKFQLKNLNATVSYAVRVSSVSNRGIEGPLSGIVKEIYLTSESWPAKFVSQLSCAPDSSTTIQLRWSVSFNNIDLTHFRVNFTGVTKFQSDKSIVSKMREEQEQSSLIYDKNKYYTHQIRNLKPNTRYTINIEPIFSPHSIMIGDHNQTICTTFRDVPIVIEAPILNNINRTSNEIEILIQRPILENGTIDSYYIVVKISKQISQTHRKKRFSEGVPIEELSLEDIDSKVSKSDVYIALSLHHDDIFHLTTPAKYVHKVTMGSGEKKGSFINKKLHSSLYYQFKILACIRVGESQNKKLRCKSSLWSIPVNTKSSVLPENNKFKPIIETNNSFKSISKGPNSFTTTTVVVILGTVIFAVFSMSIFLFIKRRQLLKSKLGNVYGSHSNRINNEKSICMEHLLKEPLVDSSVRISTSGSLRFKTHGNNCIEVNKIQLSTTPDLLVRSSVPQPFSSHVQFHGQHLSNKHFEYAPIPVEALAEQVALLKENDGALFNKEYESIEPGQQFTWNNSNMEVNRLKNRYANVIAYDHSRVVLQSLMERKNSNNNETRLIPGSDYINANYISGYLVPKAYIATQGPIAESIGDFWRMMWEQNSSVIVMMTRLEERDRTKCDQYWPLGGKGSIATYSSINVTIIDITELAYYTIRKFHIQKLSESSIREVYQLQFTAWPDHGVPNHPAPLLMFLRRVHSEIPRNCGPIIVHCSAGVGRTGAFIVIDYMLERLRYENTVDIYNYVTNIRAQRNYMVQTEDQYIFIYETLLEAIQCGNTEVPVSELASHIEKLNQIEISHKTVDGIQMTGLQMEFENLVLSSEGFLQGIKLNANNLSHCSTPSTTHGNIVTNYQPLTYDTATQMVNQMKNRIIQILPPDFSRVNICPIRGVEGSDYINASWIDGYKSRRAYIGAQSPLAETCEDFWRTLWEHNSSIIVMLTQLKENNRERCYQYWPFKRSSRYQFFIVDPVAEYNMTTYIIREFKLTDTRDSQSRVIRQFQFTQWQESESIPHSTHVFLDLINQVQKTKVQLGHDGPITVHCSAGSGRTGIFLALSNIIERMKNESVIDLFQTVKLLRWQRPALLQTEDQYQFCYMAALEYLKLFEQIQFDL